MPAFLFSLVGVLVCALGARDQRLMAQLSAHTSRGALPLMIGYITTIGTSFAAAAAGQYVADMLPAAAKTMLVAIALLFAAVELAWPVRMGKMEEPTRSLVALALVLTYRQIGDAARFLIFAFSAAYAGPWFAGLGGALGGIIAITAGWLLGDDMDRVQPIRTIRWIMAFVLLIAAIITGLTARGLLG